MNLLSEFPSQNAPGEPVHAPRHSFHASRYAACRSQSFASERGVKAPPSRVISCTRERRLTRMFHYTSRNGSVKGFRYFKTSNGVHLNQTSSGNGWKTELVYRILDQILQLGEHGVGEIHNDWMFVDSPINVYYVEYLVHGDFRATRIPKDTMVPETFPIVFKYSKYN